AIHEDTQTRWAVKIESEKCDRKRMKLEIMVLMLLRGKANIPEIMAMGTCPTGHFIILELVGRNLSDLRRQLPQRKLSHGTLYRAMLQIELGDGSLPWSKMRDEAAIKTSKQETTVEKLCEKQPKMLKMAEYVLSMKYDTMPDYDKLTKMLESCHPPEVGLNDPYDWQKIACQLDHLVKKDRSADQPAGSLHKPVNAENKNQVVISLISDLEKQKHPSKTPSLHTPYEPVKAPRQG
ncbi:hypothetical protein TELCIR_14683, partial [Teladorsagia circumcincta]